MQPKLPVSLQPSTHLLSVCTALGGDLYISWERGRDTFDRLLIDGDHFINKCAARPPQTPLLGVLTLPRRVLLVFAGVCGWCYGKLSCS